MFSLPPFSLSLFPYILSILFCWLLFLPTSLPCLFSYFPNVLSFQNTLCFPTSVSPHFSLAILLSFLYFSLSKNLTFCLPRSCPSTFFINILFPSSRLRRASKAEKIQTKNTEACLPACLPVWCSCLAKKTTTQATTSKNVCLKCNICQQQPRRVGFTDIYQ